MTNDTTTRNDASIISASRPSSRRPQFFGMRLAVIGIAVVTGWIALSSASVVLRDHTQTVQPQLSPAIVQPGSIPPTRDRWYAESAQEQEVALTRSVLATVRDRTLPALSAQKRDAWYLEPY